MFQEPSKPGMASGVPWMDLCVSCNTIPLVWHLLNSYWFFIIMVSIWLTLDSLFWNQVPVYRAYRIASRQNLKELNSYLLCLNQLKYLKDNVTVYLCFGLKSHVFWVIIISFRSVNINVRSVGRPYGFIITCFDSY